MATRKKNGTAGEVGGDQAATLTRKAHVAGAISTARQLDVRLFANLQGCVP